MTDLKKKERKKNLVLHERKFKRIGLRDSYNPNHLNHTVWNGYSLSCIIVLRILKLLKYTLLMKVVRAIPLGCLHSPFFRIKRLISHSFLESWQLTTGSWVFWPNVCPWLERATSPDNTLPSQGWSESHGSFNWGIIVLGYPAGPYPPQSSLWHPLRALLWSHLSKTLALV